MEIPSRSLISGNTKSCGCLNQELRLQRIIKYNKDNFKDLTGQKRGLLTILEPTEQRAGTNIVWKCKCECGNICYVSSNNLNKNIVTHTKSCGCLNLQPSNLVDLTGQRFGKLLALEPTLERKYNCIVWKCQCDCGNLVFVASGNLKSGTTKSCGCLKSKGEEKIAFLLQQHNIVFTKEKIFDSCILPSGFHPRFDFFVDNKYLIEFDGIQHFFQTGWEELSVIQQRDAYKNQWCKDNNIILIRIPYTQLEQLCIEDLLLETSHFVI